MLTPERQNANLDASLVPKEDCHSCDIPLVVDIDGTLLKTDLLFESIAAMLIQQPLAALRVPSWIYLGRAHLKARLADGVALDLDHMPLDPEVMAFVTTEKESGRRIFLASASDTRFIEALARRIGAESRVFASDGIRNLKAGEMRNALVAAFGERGFDYIGNSRDDRPIWESARKVYVAQLGRRNPTHEAHEVISRRRGKLAAAVSSLRLHQWAKNLLLFAPLVLGGAVGNLTAVITTVLAFLAFGILASASYLLNDIVDVGSDRKHSKKRRRALASGDLLLTEGAFLAFGGCAIGLLIGASIGLGVFLALLGYLVLTLAYSLWLKRVPILDAVMLASLYTWRLLTGIITAGVMLSPWLLVFSFAFFLSLSLVKRIAEIGSASLTNGRFIPGRGYQVADGPFVMCLGVAAGMSSVLIFVLYLIDGAFRAAHFNSPQLLWGCPVVLLLWLCRVWLLASRGELSEDPVAFAVRDRVSLCLGAVGAIQVTLAIL